MRMEVPDGSLLIKVLDFLILARFMWPWINEFIASRVVSCR